MIELLIDGRLPLRVDGQIELPKAPPFDVLTPGAAVVLTVELEPESPRSIKLFDHWYATGGRLQVQAVDKSGTRVRAAMRCTAVEHHDGIQATRAWEAPLRRAHADGRCALYRPTPRWQSIARPVHRYVLESEAYEVA